MTRATRSQKLRHWVWIISALGHFASARADNWQNATSPENINAALATTLAALKQHKIQFSQKAIYFSPNKVRYRECEQNPDFHATFKGFARVIGYYLLFRQALEGVYPYATADAFILNEQTGQQIAVEKFDYLIQKMDFDQLRDWAELALASLSEPDKQYLQRLIYHFQRTYKTFSQHLTPELITELQAKSEASPFNFYQFGFPAAANCFAERFYTGDVFGGDVFHQQKTYFSIGSLDNYLYSFWWRRYDRGTINLTKALLDEVQFLLETPPQ